MADLCRCGHEKRWHYVEPLFLKNIAPCWRKVTGGQACGCMVYRPKLADPQEARRG